ncbi:hypothetical protein BJ508DRAFT_304257 [Ascobolus immersus RN42]|uniref:Uncharacterized protein n=1 Tax=Ascobolus immersus RN42 TaxID=1160509 RepID=A0A3N4IR86_ASCIM|nr:hypothetical protein BJ508DRAFT_304257 [Ascobolus immersus RN42]
MDMLPIFHRHAAISSLTRPLPKLDHIAFRNYAAWLSGVQSLVNYLNLNDAFNPAICGHAFKTHPLTPEKIAMLQVYEEKVTFAYIVLSNTLPFEFYTSLADYYDVDLGPVEMMKKIEEAARHAASWLNSLGPQLGGWVDGFASTR